MLQAAVFTTALALAFAAVLALVLFNGRLSPTARRRVEFAQRGVAVAIFIPLYGWGLIARALDGNWLWVAFQPVLWIWLAVSLLLERRRKARAKDRQPGTFA